MCSRSKWLAALALIRYCLLLVAQLNYPAGREFDTYGLGQGSATFTRRATWTPHLQEKNILGATKLFLTVNKHQTTYSIFVMLSNQGSLPSISKKPSCPICHQITFTWSRGTSLEEWWRLMALRIFAAGSVSAWSWRETNCRCYLTPVSIKHFMWSWTSGDWHSHQSDYLGNRIIICTAFLGIFAPAYN